MVGATELWRMIIGGRHFLGLIPHDLAYFNEYFIGMPIPTPWTPPTVELDGKSKRLPDFVSWMKSAPVISDRARCVLEPLVGAAVQFLPFHSLKGKPYYAMNVLEVQHGLLNLVKSDIDRFTTDGSIMAINRAVFRHPLPLGLPPIFKLGEGTGDIFVTTEFAKLVVQQQLTGVSLLSPAQDPLILSLGREPLNAYPGTSSVDT